MKRVNVFAKHVNENVIFTEPEGWTPLDTSPEPFLPHLPVPVESYFTCRPH
jgi:hypothetical protein